MKHIDKVFKEKLSNHETNVPEGMWDKIAPALEEKSSRGLLWFWITGLAVLLIGGLIYMLSVSTPTTSPLTDNIKTPQEQSSSMAESTPAIQQEELNSDIADSDAQIEKSEVTKVIKSKTSTVSNNNTNKPTPPQAASEANVTASLSAQNTTSEVKDEIIYGKPADLVITKSYINDNGAVIKQSNISSDDEKPSPVYNVFINSEGLNAGALLRVVQPIQKLPLPAISLQKKKVTI